MDAILVAKRFWPKVDKTDGCWNWNSALTRKGYGTFNVGGDEKTHLAHRVSWALAHGGFPLTGACVCHKCDNCRCVNPDHLVVVQFDHRL